VTGRPPRTRSGLACAPSCGERVGCLRVRSCSRSLCRNRSGGMIDLVPRYAGPPPMASPIIRGARSDAAEAANDGQMRVSGDLGRLRLPTIRRVSRGRATCSCSSSTTATSVEADKGHLRPEDLRWLHAEGTSYDVSPDGKSPIRDHGSPRRLARLFVDSLLCTPPTDPHAATPADQRHGNFTVF